MNRQRVEEILRDKLRWTAGAWLDPDHSVADLACLAKDSIDVTITGLDDAADAIVKEMRRENQLARLPCGHSTAWATDEGCGACDYEERIAKLIAQRGECLSVIQAVRHFFSSEYRARILRRWTRLVRTGSVPSELSSWLDGVANALDSFGERVWNEHYRRD